MRKADKEQAAEFLKVLGSAHSGWKKLAEADRYDAACDMLYDCQQGAVRLGNMIESSEGEDFDIVRMIGNYCEWIYQICEKLHHYEADEVISMYEESHKLLEQIADSLHHETAENTQACIERLGAYFAMEMYGAGFISDTESYLDAHSEELVYKASLAAKEREALVEEIARLEFRAFDKVKNEGGRASCQNDWSTFSIMRKSQYLTWNREMLQQYLYDFNREYHRGHNLIEEKYGRMMESTAPEKYEEIRTHFPELSEEKKAIIEHIVGMQVAWMEEFGAQYPALAGNARKIHTSEDTAEDTSYETYLRGELSTYSDKMLELYGRYVVEYARSGRNTAYEIMENSVKMYGYQDVETAEKEITEYESKRV